MQEDVMMQNEIIENEISNSAYDSSALYIATADSLKLFAVVYQTPRCHISVESNIRMHRSDNPKSHSLYEYRS
jgi:hypothetical protein